MATQMREKGSLAQITVLDIVRAARTSKRTFYQCFSDKEECYLALLIDLNNRVLAAVESAISHEQSWPDQVRAAVHAMIAGFAAEPALTLSWARGAPALGTRSRKVQRETTATFVRIVVTTSRDAAQQNPHVRPIPPTLALAFAAGARELVSAGHEGRLSADEVSTAIVDMLLSLSRPLDRS